MAPSVVVRAGWAVAGTYLINAPKGRLELLGRADIRVDLRGIAIQVMSTNSATPGMAKNAAVGGLLLGGAGAALGALASRSDVVLFEARWPDGRVIVGQCSPSDYQELLVAQHSKARASVPPKPSRQVAGAAGTAAATLFSVFCVGTCMYTCGAFEPLTGQAPSNAASIAPVTSASSTAGAEQPRAWQQAMNILGPLRTYDGTRGSRRRAASLAIDGARRYAIDCRTANYMAKMLMSQGHDAAAGEFNREVRNKVCRGQSMPEFK